MLKRIREKWNVGKWQLTVILLVFAMGGSFCGYLSRQVLGLFEIEDTTFRIPLYILLVTLLWPICVIVISIPFGQFFFFRNYLKRVFRRITGSSQ
jgi:uncharacterized membrane protein